jgi:hypothetical protein
MKPVYDRHERRVKELWRSWPRTLAAAFIRSRTARPVHPPANGVRSGPVRSSLPEHEAVKGIYYVQTIVTSEIISENGTARMGETD